MPANAEGAVIETAQCSWCRRWKPVSRGVLDRHRNLAGGWCRGSGRPGLVAGPPKSPPVALVHPKPGAPIERNEVTRLLYRLGARSGTPPWSDVLRRDPCCYCGVRVQHMTLDHIVPRASGASGRRPTADNATPACPSCNQEKGSQSLLAFLVTRPEARAAAQHRVVEPLAIVMALRMLGGRGRAREVGRLVGAPAYSVGMALARLGSHGVVVRTGRFTWALPGFEDVALASRPKIPLDFRLTAATDRSGP